MRVAPPVELTEDQERALHQWARGRSLPARQVERARVVLLAAAGKQDLEIAAEIGISPTFAVRANSLPESVLAGPQVVQRQ